MSDGRLNFADVEQLVAGLSDRVLEELVKGPLPDGDDPTSPWNCRVCGILRGPHQTPPMTALLDWHEFEPEVDAIDSLFKELEGWPEFEDADRAAEQWKQVAGMLSHARCCVIYALARIELAGRRL